MTVHTVQDLAIVFLITVVAILIGFMAGLASARRAQREEWRRMRIDTVTHVRETGAGHGNVPDAHLGAVEEST